MQKKIKILFVLAQMVGGGAERVTINIIRILDRKLFDIHLVVMSKEGPAYEYLPRDIILHDLNVSKTIFSIYKLRKVVENIEPDIVYSTLFRTHKALYFALKGIKKKPIVFLRSQNSPKLLLKNNKMNFISKYLLEKSYINADFIIAQTDEMKNEINMLHQIDIEKIHVLSNPLDTDNIDKEISNIQNPFNVNYINVVAAGRLYEQKGFDVLIKSFIKVIEKNSNFRLYIIGEDVIGELKNLQHLVDSLGLDAYIHFLGYQKNPYLYFYFSDLYVLSSRWEGLPNTVLENLYLKKPVIATKCIPYLEELIQEGKNGYLVNVDDIEELANAILKYKKLTLEFSSRQSPQTDVDSFFQLKGVKKNEKY